jgi:carboxymethylenebutenolidase
MNVPQSVKGEYTRLRAADGHEFSAYVAQPSGSVRGGVVIVQEIFGVNRHIRAVADDYAAHGYRAIAPALFDRVRANVELPYTDSGRDEGREVVAGVSFDAAVRDVEAARAALTDAGAIGIVGFCWGGTVAWNAVTQSDGFAAAACYYPGRIGEFASRTPRCQVQFHFAEHDHSIGPAEIARVRAAQGAGVEVFVYPAAHGFNCDLRAAYDASSASLARERTLRLLAENEAAR